MEKNDSNDFISESKAKMGTNEEILLEILREARAYRQESEKILESLVALKRDLQELQKEVSNLKETLTDFHNICKKSAEPIQNKPKILTPGFESKRIQDERQLAEVVKKTTIPFQDSALTTLQKLNCYRWITVWYFSKE